MFRPNLVAGLIVLSVVCQRSATASPSATATNASSVAVFPEGDVFPFMGYSGVPERDAMHGFTVAGPSYGKNQEAALAAAEAAGMSYPFMVGLDMKFHAKPPEKPLDLSEEEIKKRITEQVAEVVSRKSICWWYLTPEELRPWRKNEMDYLKAATEAIRAADPFHRPIWMYEPNHRDADSLRVTGRNLDIIGKGLYTNLAGYQDNRIWVRWSLEQETQAIAALTKEDGRPRTPLVMPELCADPKDPADDHLIPRWARHDIYLGLMCGGKGVAIWSLFPRGEVRRTWRIWYDSYSGIATELTGPLALGQVFLHGRDASLVKVSILDGPRELPLTKGAKNSLESSTTNEIEKKEALVTYPALCVRQLEFQGSTYVFLCNSSASEAIKYQSETLPAGSTVTDVFSWQPYRTTNGRLYGWLAPLEVRCYRVKP